MRRRKFLKQAGTFGFAAAGFSQLGYSATPTSRPKIVGHGDFRYKVDKKWGALDASLQPVQHCHEMVMDSQGRLLCSMVGRRANVLIYSKYGRLQDSWRLNLSEPHGLSKAGEGKAQTFLITDSAAGRVLHLAPDGRLIRELSVPADQIPHGKSFRPTETAMAANGDIYVADGYGTNLIFHYDPKGQLKDIFGGPDHFDCCHGIAIDDRSGQETLLITNQNGQELQRWSMGGQHLSTRRFPGLRPCRPVIDGENTYFAVIATASWTNYDGMVAVLDKDFEVVSLPGGSAPTDQDDFTNVRHDGKTFLNPHDVCPDKDGNLYVPQWFSGRTYPIRLRRV
jgi:sugar lactone lactonase YvrE